MNNKLNEKISVIMNCRNGEEFLIEAIDSVVNQTHKNWELIFCDNDSKDNSTLIAKSYNNEKIKIYNTDKYLICGDARNFALSRAKGRYIAFLDCDDIWKKDKLELQLDLIKKTNNKIVYTNSFIKGKSLKILSKKKLPEGRISKQIINHNPIIFSSIFFDNDIFFKYNYRFKNYEIIEDLDLFFRLSQNFNFSVVQDPMVIYRDHQNMISKKKFELHIKELETWAEENKNILDYKDLSKLKSNIYYNKSSINLKNNNFDNFLENLKFVKGYNLIIRLLLKFIIQKLKKK